jgi:hypothetical protein
MPKLANALRADVKVPWKGSETLLKSESYMYAVSADLGFEYSA